MKYHEAIDMILDGGRARRLGQDEPIIWYEFHADQLLAVINSEIRTTLLYKDCFVKEDWIVEKDGVVYEESLRDWFHNGDGMVKVTAYVPCKQLYKIPKTDAGLKKLDDLKESGGLFFDERGTPLERRKEIIIIKGRTHNQDESAELEDNGKKWEEIKMPIIADEVNEQWLEKKMLCVIRREHKQRFNGWPLDWDKIECNYRECPFCFPAEEEAAGINPEDYPCLANPKDAKTDHIKEPREKVTVEDVMVIVDSLNEHVQNYSPLNDGKSRAVFFEKYRQLKESIEKKLKYLVSLQERQNERR